MPVAVAIQLPAVSMLPEICVTAPVRSSVPASASTVPLLLIGTLKAKVPVLAVLSTSAPAWLLKAFVPV